MIVRYWISSNTMIKEIMRKDDIRILITAGKASASASFRVLCLEC